jgi:VIT1/CCC1 family predicted Fe2+/Mn2+ transporter
MKAHRETHRVGRTGWLRAAVLGANDGLISTSSLVVGMSVAGAGTSAVLMAGVAGLVAGSLSMAAGEYVSVSSQSDSENADLARERRVLAVAPDAEQRELAGHYVERGLSPGLAEQVASEMMAHDALTAHARDELGIVDFTRARPIQAAFASATSFAVGALPPLLVALMVTGDTLPVAVAIITFVLLLGLGALAARLGGARPLRGSLRVAFWGAVAMGGTAAVGQLFDTIGR